MSTEGVKFREARPEDAAIISTAEWQTAQTPGYLNALPGEIPLSAYEDKIQSLAAHPAGLYLVAEVSGRSAGHLLLDPMPLQQNAHVCGLTIVVHPGFTGRGIGRQLLDHAIGWAVENERLEKIELRVRAGNHRAIQLYQSLGFEEEGRSRGRLKYSDGSYEDDVLMGRSVCGVGP